MRIALLVRRLSVHGGTERFALGWAAYLAAAGHRVEAWCWGADAVPEGVDLRRLPSPPRGRLARALAFARAARALPEGAHDLVVGLSRALGCDLVRAGGGCHDAAMDGRRWSVADEVEREIDRRALLPAMRVVVNSRMAGEQLVGRYGLSPERLRLVRNGVDLERFRPDPAGRLPVPRPAVAFLGSGWRRKGLDTAIRVVARLPGVHLVVVGDDPRPGRFRRLAERLGVAGRVAFLGPRPDPERLLPAADALLLPTRYDSSANACLEAMACGVPAVTTRRDGAAEVLPEPWMAVDDPEDIDALAHALERALREPGLRSACRAAAERWPVEGAFRRMTRIAEEVAAERGTA